MEKIRDQYWWKVGFVGRGGDYLSTTLDLSVINNLIYVITVIYVI